MRTNKFDLDHAELKGRRNNKPVVVAFDVEHDAPVFQNARASVGQFDVRGLLSVRLLRLVQSSFGRLIFCGVLCPKILRSGHSNNSDARSAVPKWDSFTEQPVPTTPTTSLTPSSPRCHRLRSPRTWWRQVWLCLRRWCRAPANSCARSALLRPTLWGWR